MHIVYVYKLLSVLKIPKMQFVWEIISKQVKPKDPYYFCTSYVEIPKIAVRVINILNKSIMRIHIMPQHKC